MWFCGNAFKNHIPELQFDHARNKVVQLFGRWVTGMAGKPVSKKILPGSHSASEKRKLHGPQPVEPDSILVREFVWTVISINSHVEKIRSVWASALDISCPQWLILMAVRDMDQGNGISVGEVSAKLHVDPSFVTTQSKSLEKQGFMLRIPSKQDARVVLMSLTDKAKKQIKNLYARQEVADTLVFSEYTDQSLRELNKKLLSIRDRLAKAARVIAAEI